MRVLLILPALTEAKSPLFRPIKYSLFPPLGLATLAAYLPRDTDVQIYDEHVERDLRPHDWSDHPPDLVVVQTYITNAFRAYRLADHFRQMGCFVAIGGLHATSLPQEAAPHADAIFLGPGEQTFPEFLARWLRDPASARGVYDSRGHGRSLANVPPIRRDLIRRPRYLVPNSIVVSRGCPHHCTFCYKDAFFEGGRSFYTQRVDAALAEIERLPGRHLYFLDDHLFGDERFARGLFEGLKGCGRVFQGAATIDSVLRGRLLDFAVDAGLRSLFIGFESLGESTLSFANKKQNLLRSGGRKDYERAIRRLDALGVSINASFVFGLDGDNPGVFDRTVDWAVDQGITTATFHIATPYPGTAYHRALMESDRIVHENWDLYDTRHVVFRPRGMSADDLESGYWRAYRRFYSWPNIFRAARAHESPLFGAKCGAYAAAWRKLEPLWNLLIRSGALGLMRPVIESGLEAARSFRERSPAVEAIEATGLSDAFESPPPARSHADHHGPDPQKQTDPGRTPGSVE